jgi:hypothetical protein
VIRAAAAVVLSLGLAACSAFDSWLPAADPAPAPRPNRIGVVSLYGDDFLAVKMAYLTQYNSWTSPVPDWGLDDYILQLARDAVGAAGQEYVAVEYDRAALSRAYDPRQPLSDIQSALVDTFSLGMTESPVRYFDADQIELDLRALCRAKALDQLLLVTRGRHKMVAGAGLIHSDVEDDTRFFSLLDLTVFECPGPHETDWDNVRTAKQVEGRMWVNKLDKLPPEARKAFEGEIKALIKRGFEQAMARTAAVQPASAGGEPDDESAADADTP